MKTTIMSALTMCAIVFSSQAMTAAEIHERMPASADGLVQISNVAGRLRIVGWERNEVEVAGTLGEGVKRVDIDSGDGVIRIRVIVERNRDADADLVVQVPVRSRLIASTVSAPITAEGVNGNIELKSVSGKVTLDGGFTEAEVNSVSGDVQLQRAGSGARVKLRSTSGTVATAGFEGELQASSVSGTVMVQGRGIKRATLNSVSGRVEFDGPLARDGHYEMETVSGRVKLRVQGRVDAEFDLSTFSGGIRNDFGPQAERTSEYAPGLALRFSAGRGGALVRMRAVSGTLELSGG